MEVDLLVKELFEPLFDLGLHRGPSGQVTFLTMELLAGDSAFITDVDSGLTLVGLRMVYERNRGRH